MKRLLATVLAAVGLALSMGPAQAAKDTIVLGAVLEPPHLDPTAGAAAAIDEVVYANVFEGLTRIDQNGSVKPALAKSWTISDDGLTYTFTLNEGVKFHDGSAFDSTDVVFSLKRAMAEDSVNAQKGLFKPIKNVEAPDAKTVVVTLNQPTGHFLFNLGWGDAVIVAEESAENNKTKPIGTGPFLFKSWTKGDKVVLERNPDYWGEAVKLKTATIKFISDPAAAVASLMAGDVDAFSNFPAPESVAQFKADPRFQVVVGSTEGETILSTNNKSEYFSKLKVRQAVAHAIDRQAIVDGAMHGFGTPIGSHFPPHHPAYVNLTGTYPFDLDKAKALIAEAGYPNGFKARLHLPPPPYARRGGEIIAAQLKKIGIELEIIPVEWAQWLQQVFKSRDYDLTIVSHTEPQDIGIYARDDYYFNYDNPDFKALMTELDGAADPAKRNEILGRSQKMLANDAVNGFLFQLAQVGVWNAKLRGLWPSRPVQANDLTAAHWVD